MFMGLIQFHLAIAIKFGQFFYLYFFVGNGLSKLKLLQIIHLTAERISDNMV